eukprot:m.18701 g.18701  ORF g.18701 m.18701 type:complete len:500 (-) comp12169_c0_seq1:116-1615(-)
MPKKKKQFIDKNDPRTHSFSLVHRSQRDPLAADPDAPQVVLAPVAVGDNVLPKIPLVRSTPGASISKEVDYTEKANLADAGILFDDNYDYSQHLKERRPEDDTNVYAADPKALAKVLEDKGLPPSTGSDLGYEHGDALVLPSDMLASAHEEDIGILNLAAPHTGPRLDWDPEVIAALDDDFDFEDADNELQDDFMSMALNDTGVGQEGQGEDQEFDSDGTWVSDDEDDEFRDNLGVLENVDRIGRNTFNNEDTKTEKSRFTEYSMTSSILTRSEAMQTHDDRFEKLYEQYDDEEIGALDEQEDTIGGTHTIDMYADILDAFVEDVGHEFEAKALDIDKSKTAAKSITDLLENTNLGDDAEPPAIETLFQPKKEREFDCESILSTRSTLYNHPRRIVEQAKKIKINRKTGLPIEDEVEANDEDEDEDDEEDSIPENLGVARAKKETAEEKKARKQAIKDTKKERRVVKKGTKVAFKDEEKRQKKLHSSNPAFGKKIKSLA